MSNIEFNRFTHVLMKLSIMKKIVVCSEEWYAIRNAINQHSRIAKTNYNIRCRRYIHIQIRLIIKLGILEENEYTFKHCNIIRALACE